MANMIDPSLMLKNYQNEQRKTGSDVLGKDDFLKLLMVQLQNQDPTSPMDDKEFISQMAQFSTLEQMTNIGSSMNKMISLQEQNQLISYNQFVGKEIVWHKLKESSDGNFEIEEGTGTIASIQFKDQSVLFILDDGTKLEPGNISQVKESGSSENYMIQASMMIGKKVTYMDEEKAEHSAIIQSVSFKDGKALFQLDNEEGTKVSSSQIIKIETK
ncbi:flagellar hook assembly protein FlgD [Cytobacillus purgationiresistens]|uniref:Basal-body rod modification protein FlgD n=1 Tax=Cytobacillus purgationiresistens TaxID=863449 RepID=A0ABU0AGQ3_9BACI|nr:flagellar hook assembly protein FlgD [Cytobacillus purgationiresistens]MDQ0270225.1 flagellar basal-body rod modification protein FlgD [Cytobacillus purgationiresistens]